MAQVLLFRILERKEDIAPDRIPGLFVVLGDGMDDFARRLPERLGSPPWLYGDAREVFRLIEGLDAGERLPVLKGLFANAASLAWLTAIVSDAIAEHGFAGHRAEPVEQRLLTEEEFECIRIAFLERLERSDAADLKETPFFLSLLYGWHYAGDGKKATAWVRKHSSNDADFIDLIRRMMSKRSISYGNGTREDYYLARQTLEMFFGSVDAAETRLDEMRYNESIPEEQRMEAEQLFSSIEREAQA